MRILLVGEESAGVQVLRAVAGTGHEIVAVMTSGSAEPGRPSLETVASSLGYEVWPARLIKDSGFAAGMPALKIDLLLNVHSMYIVPQPVLDACRIGAFNLHPGPLPRYAGLNVMSWAIYKREPSHGVTLHWMVKEIDAGDIAYEASFPIEPNDTPLLLTLKCVKAGVPLVLELVETAARNPAAIPRKKQDLSKRQYFGKEVPQDGRLFWDRPAKDIVRFVRACDYAPYPSPWGHPRTALEAREILVTKATPTGMPCGDRPGTVGQCDDSAVLVAAGDEWVAMRQVQLDGKTLKPQSVLRPGALLLAGG